MTFMVAMLLNSVFISLLMTFMVAMLLNIRQRSPHQEVLRNVLNMFEMPLSVTVSSARIVDLAQAFSTSDCGNGGEHDVGT